MPTQPDDAVKGGRRDRAADDVQIGPGKQRPQRSIGKEPEMTAVEHATIRIVETTDQEQEPDPHVRDIWDRDDDEAVGLEDAIERHQDAERIIQMLEDIAVNDDVEGALQGRDLAVEIGNHHAFTVGRPGGRQHGVSLDRGHAPPALRQPSAQQTVGGTDVEQSPTLTIGQPLQDDRMTAVGVAFECVLRGRQ